MAQGHLREHQHCSKLGSVNSAGTQTPSASSWKENKPGLLQERATGREQQSSSTWGCLGSERLGDRKEQGLCLDFLSSDSSPVISQAAEHLLTH